MEVWRATYVAGQTMDNYLAAQCCDQEETGLVATAVAAAECLAAARETVAAMRQDPGTPGLENTYFALLTELSNLATIYSMSDQTASQYSEVCAATDALLEASELAKPTWAFLRY
jgi:hypothetical protein